MAEDNNITVLCVSTTSALCHFIGKGLDPGSFGRALLKRDATLARRKSHAALRRAGGVESMLAFVEKFIPAGMFATDEDIDLWIEQGGIDGASPTQILLLHMAVPHRWWDKLNAI